MSHFIHTRPGYLRERFYFLGHYRIEKDFPFHLIEFYRMSDLALLSVFRASSYFNMIKILKIKIKEVLRWQRKIKNSLFFKKKRERERGGDENYLWI